MSRKHKDEIFNKQRERRLESSDPAQRNFYFRDANGGSADLVRCAFTGGRVAPTGWNQGIGRKEIPSVDFICP